MCRQRIQFSMLLSYTTKLVYSISIKLNLDKINLSFFLKFCLKMNRQKHFYLLHFLVKFQKIILDYWTLQSHNTYLNSFIIQTNQQKSTIVMKFFFKVCAALFYDLLSISVLVYFASFLPIILSGTSIQAGNIELQLFIIMIAVFYFFYCFKI